MKRPSGVCRRPSGLPQEEQIGELAAKKRRVVLKDGPDGGLYRVSVEQDATGFDLLEAATPDCNNRERARVTLRKADGAVLDLRAPVPVDADAFGEGAVVVEVAPPAATVAAPSVLEQLAGCVVKPAIEQYGKYLGHADTTLRDRKEALRVLAEAAVRSVEATADNPRHLVVFAGPSGSGKTRGGYEGSAMWDHTDGRDALEEALKGKPEEVADKLRGLHGSDRAPGDNVLTLYIDLNNGLQYHSDIDKLDPDVRLGARLAAQALDATHNDVGLQDMVRFPPEQLRVAKVLSAILRGQLGQRQAAGIRTPLLLVVHVDEWQLYMERLVKTGRSVEDAVADVKAMFSTMNSFAFDPSDLKDKFMLLPILSGTPVLGGVQLELTRRMMRVDGPLPALSGTSASDLFVEALTKAGFDESEVRNMLDSVTARVGLSDTGCFPRLLVRLCSHVVQSAVEFKTRGDEKALWHVTWAKGAEKASEDLPGADAVDRALPLLVLTGQAVEINHPHGNLVETGMAKVVRDADQSGLVQLRKVQQDVNSFVAEVPFLMLRSWCSGRDFPEGLLRPISEDDAWTWYDFERLYAHFTAARLNALLEAAGGRPTARALGDVIKGARGSDTLLAQQVCIRGTRQVHWEEKQFMPGKADQPEKVESVLVASLRCAQPEEIKLHAGVFLAKAGNSLFDMRYTLEAAAAGQPAVHVFMQDRHTVAATKVNTEAITNWYKEADVATNKWCAGETDSVALLYFTNCELADHDALNNDFFHSRPRLLVVTRAELSDALTRTFVGRGLIPQNPRPT